MIGDKVGCGTLDEIKIDSTGTVIDISEESLTVKLDNPFPVRFLAENDVVFYFEPRTFVTKIKGKKTRFKKV